MDRKLTLISAIDPSFPLARLRVRDQLALIRPVDLSFTAGEAAVFLIHIMGLNLFAGWIGGQVIV
jgi:LuxR family maltose regulon positive regulatory protein